MGDNPLDLAPFVEDVRAVLSDVPVATLFASMSYSSGPSGAGSQAMPHLEHHEIRQVGAECTHAAVERALAQLCGARAARNPASGVDWLELALQTHPHSAGYQLHEDRVLALVRVLAEGGSQRRAHEHVALPVRL